MATLAFGPKQRARELRRRVVLPARLRIGARWSDACILNISSRGMMIRAGGAISEGSLVEVRRGEHAIVARVVWLDGSRAGLRAEERLPVEDILTLAQTPGLQLTAADSLSFDRRNKRRPAFHESRHRGRVIQFIGTLAIAAGLSAAILSMVEHAFAKPMAAIQAALGG